MRSFFPYIFGAMVFFIAVIVTEATFWADAPDYVDSVVAFHQNKNYNFWEFGHLFWQPLGWSVWSQLFPQTETQHWRSEIILIFQWFNYLAGFVSTIILVGILKKLKLPAWIVTVVAFSFVFSHAFLNFTQTGTSYVSALMFYFLGLFFSLGQMEEKNFFNPVSSGVCFALSLCFWMPFLYTIPVAIIAPLVLYGFSRKRLIEAGVKIISFSSVIVLSYGIVLSILQIYSLSELKGWITASSHGNETSGIMRMIFGLVRSFVNMGNDGILFKRFLLNDPFNPVTFLELLGGTLWKVSVFYSLTAGVLFLLWQNAQSRKIFILLLVAALPLLSFAALFDGGAVERYLPLFPFAFISLAVALQTDGWRFLRYAMVAIVATFGLLNLSVFSFQAVAERQKKIVSRIDLLETRLAPKDTIFLVNWTDDLINFSRSFPFNPINLRGNLKLFAVVTPGLAQNKQWREEFATRSFLAWEKGRNVWLSSRALSEKPKPDWNWVEGDDKNVSWQEFPAFFSKLELGERLGDENGFTLILPTETNKRFLQEYKIKFTQQIYEN